MSIRAEPLPPRRENDPRFVGVVPLTPVEGVFTYSVPAGLAPVVGARVVVPFGRRSVMGVVVDDNAGHLDGAKPVLEVLEGQPSLPGDLLDLTRWISEYYLCSWGEALGAALPSGLIWKGDADSGKRVRAKTERRLSLAFGADEAPDSLRGVKQRALVRVLQEAGGEMARAKALRLSHASSQTARTLVERGVLAARDVEIERKADGLLAAAPPAATLDLNEAQQEALSTIGAAVESGHAATFLLHGVTGSGKTEVYIRVLKAALSRGAGAIVLVPEIALTPQTVRRFRAHFGDRVAVLHSRMSDGERFDAWRGIRGGRYPVVIGPRSAVLAPVERLGLIVVDEEHEASYKQFDPAPRYHARDVAVMRAHRAGAVCVLGSATPSLESVANARGGKYRLIEMPERVPVRGGAAARLPEVRLVNLVREKKMRRLKGALSDELREAIRNRLECREQIILLQNRRGFAPVLICEACGHTPECPDCAVTMTVHTHTNQLRCHYCGRAARKPRRCAACDSQDLAFIGVGTQRVEEEISGLFPDSRVLRMDFDTTTGKGAHRAILEAFRRGEADVLLGTQMVAKGLDFPRVTLVGVIDADTGMLWPDFRATERTFQLLTQVSGRAGRHDLPGEVLLQTRNPEHPAIRFALNGDFCGFVRYELEERKPLGYPPFGRMIGIEFRGGEEREVRRLAETWAADLSGRSRLADVLGPTPAFVGRVKQQWRYHVLLKAPSAVPAAALRAVVQQTSEALGAPKRSLRLTIDVDPVGWF